MWLIFDWKLHWIATVQYPIITTDDVSEGRPPTEGERCQPGRSDPLPGRGHAEGHHQPQHRQPHHHGGELDLCRALGEIISIQGPETSFGASNFIPSWMFWQKLPRQLQYPKTVILHRRECTSWGFSIVGNKRLWSVRIQSADLQDERQTSQYAFFIYSTATTRRTFVGSPVFRRRHRSNWILFSCPRL